jgi:hemerythrin-like domain-containing protein
MTTSSGAPPPGTVRDRHVDLATVAARVLEEHRTIRRLLDELEHASSCARDGRQESIAQLHKAIWDLYIAFEDHLVFEESDLAPLLRPAGEDLARKMILEHNEERDVLLELVEDSESDARETEDLAAEADALAARFRSDMFHEERVLSAFVPGGDR